MRTTRMSQVSGSNRNISLNTSAMNDYTTAINDFGFNTQSNGFNTQSTHYEKEPRIK